MLEKKRNMQSNSILMIFKLVQIVFKSWSQINH